MKTDTPSVTFTWDGVRRGARMCMPLAFASFFGGLGFGILAGDTGLSLFQAMGMSAFVFAGASQMVAMDVWTFPPSVLGLAIAAFAINIRHVVMGAALRPWLRDLPVLRSHAALLMMTDANWAQAMAERRKGELDAAILVGSGLVMWLGWVSGTGVGQAAGTVIADPKTFGVDMIVPAFFALTLPSLWPGVRQLHPWVVAAAVALVVHALLPHGTWHVVAGGLVGAAVGGLSRE